MQMLVRRGSLMQMLVSIGTLRITDANIDKCWYVEDNYVPQTKFGRYIVFAPFLIILIIIIILLSFFRQKFVRHISRR